MLRSFIAEPTYWRLLLRPNIATRHALDFSRALSLSLSMVTVVTSVVLLLLASLCAPGCFCSCTSRLSARQLSTIKMTDEVKVEAAPGVFLSGNLNVPPGAKGIVVFAHGSGSGRFR
jgi:hypothetical protein